MNAIVDSLKISKTGCLVAIFLFAACSQSAAQLRICEEDDFQEDCRTLLHSLPEKLADKVTLKVDLVSLFKSYRGFCRSVEYTPRNQVYIIMEDGTRILYDDGAAKTFDQKLSSPDIEDMLSLLYRPGPTIELIDEQDDPGRFRVQDFFKAVYGATRKEVAQNLVTVDFCGSPVKFNANNGAAKALKSVGDELAMLLRRRPELAKFVFPLGGAFVWRPVAGTHRLSPHSFGIAIDLNPTYGAYWRWGGRGLDGGERARK